MTLNCSYGQDGAYANYPAQQELVAKQEDESFIDRFFLGGGGGIPLPLAITLFLVDLVVSFFVCIILGGYASTIHDVNVPGYISMIIKSRI